MGSKQHDVHWDWDRYYRVLSTLAPNAHAPHKLFIDKVIERVDDRIWLDAGCGRHSFPSWREDEYDSLIERGTTYYGCDIDYMALRDRDDRSRICQAGLEHLPFKDNTFEFVSSDMVFEHLPDPESAIHEMVRVTKSGGSILIHTVNARHYLALAAKLSPHRFHQWIVGKLEGRDAKDVYPTCYKANTVSRLCEVFGMEGYSLVGGGLVSGVPMNLPYPVLFWVAMGAGLLERWLAKIPCLGTFLCPNIIVEFRKTDGLYEVNR